jgi:hypothetical protein
VIREALVAWDHSTDYPVPSYKDYGSSGAAAFTKTYRLGKEHAFLADHIVDGRILMPVCFSAPKTQLLLPGTCETILKLSGCLVSGKSVFSL